MVSAILTQTAETPRDSYLRVHATIRLNLALELAAHLALEAGVPFTSFFDLPQGTRGRLYELAERAIASLDPDTRVKAADDAIAETLDWLNGPFDGDVPDAKAIMRRVLSAFLTREARL